MNEHKVHFVTLETSSLDEYSQRELNAYRNLGSIREFRRLQHQEMHRRARQKRLHKTLELLLAGVVFAASIVVLMFIFCIFA